MFRTSLVLVVALSMNVVAESATTSPAPSLQTTTSFESNTTTLEAPAPQSTTSFDWIYCDTCADCCGVNTLRVHVDSACSCHDTCGDPSIINFGCCDYLDVCAAPNSTAPKSTTTTTPPIVTSPNAGTTTLDPTVCPRSCGAGDNSCDELNFAGTCEELEAQYSCDCSGCDCIPVTNGPTTQVIASPTGGTTKGPTTFNPPSTVITDPPTTKTTTTTTTTTTIPCPPTCYDMTCDDWTEFGGFQANTRCPYLERVHGCDCHKCLCDDAFWSTTEGGTGGVSQGPGSTEPPTTTTTTTTADDKNVGVDTSVIGGGFSNSALNDYTVIAGGRGNVATQEYSTVIGGVRNSLRSNYVTVGGGFSNTGQGRFVAVPGGRKNTAAGRHSVFLGSDGHTKNLDSVDHVLMMNFRASGGAPVSSSIDQPNTVSLQADEIYFNDVDVLALVGTARRLVENHDQVDAAVERVNALKLKLQERLAELRSLKVE